MTFYTLFVRRHFTEPVGGDSVTVIHTLSNKAAAICQYACMRHRIIQSSFYRRASDNERVLVGKICQAYVMQVFANEFELFSLDLKHMRLSVRRNARHLFTSKLLWWANPENRERNDMGSMQKP